jgi:hypothetical protein
MNDVEQRAAAKKFAVDWEGKGYEKGQSQQKKILLLFPEFPQKLEDMCQWDL